MPHQTGNVKVQNFADSDVAQTLVDGKFAGIRFRVAMDFDRGDATFRVATDGKDDTVNTEA
jgi:hypothetical protein